MTGIVDLKAEVTVHVRESGVDQDIKPGCRSRVERVANDRSRTRFAVVYMHGLCASPGECNGAPSALAKAIGANLYSHRLPGHGLNSPGATQGLNRTILLQDASWAIDVGLMLGEQVIVLGSSFGASLGLAMAARRPQDVAAVVAWSPGVRARDPQLLDQLAARNAIISNPADKSEAQHLYWSEPHSDAYVALRDVFERDMTRETFGSVECPVFMAYYYRDEANQDPTASVEAMRWMFDTLGTPPTLKQAIAYREGAHVIGSPFRSNAAGQVLRDSVAFLDAHGLTSSP